MAVFGGYCCQSVVVFVCLFVQFHRCIAQTSSTIVAPTTSAPATTQPTLHPTSLAPTVPPSTSIPTTGTPTTRHPTFSPTQSPTCMPSEYQDAATSNACVPVRECNQSTGIYMTVPATPTSNVQCSASEPRCPSGQFINSPANATSVVECANVSTCGPSDPFQIEAPTPTSDRVCNSTQPLCAEESHEYRSRSATATSNKICTSLTTCNVSFGGGKYQKVPPTATTDRICGNCSGCEIQGYQVQAPCTAFNDTTCAQSETEKPLPIADILLIVFAVVLFIGIAVTVVARVESRLKQTVDKLEDKEQLLQASNSELIHVQSTVKRMEQAWQIPEKHVKWRTKIAEGSYGHVWKGSWAGHDVAIKILQRSLDDEFEPHAETDFKSECQVLQSIRHPHLVLFFGAGEITGDKKAFIVTEFMAKGSLRSVLNDSSNILKWEQKQSVASHIASGMQYLHNLGIVHRDLKSDNCLCDIQLNTKVADFGTSKLISSEKIISEGRDETLFVSQGHASATMTKGIGTLLWMAPELFTSERHTYGPKVDVYSFAIIMWEIATRREPWDELSMTSYLNMYAELGDALDAGRRPAIPNELLSPNHAAYITTMRKCWDQTPEKRPKFSQIVEIFTVNAFDADYEGEGDGELANTNIDYAGP